jgi:hypothetical protein
MEVVKQLQAFAREGGQVIFTGTRPAISQGINFLQAGGAPVLSWARQTNENTLDAVLAPLKSDVRFQQPAPAIRYLHRHWQGAELFFFFNESDQPFNQPVMLQALGELQEWNLETGSIKKLKPIGVKKDASLVDMPLGPYESKVLVVVKNNN